MLQMVSPKVDPKKITRGILGIWEMCVMIMDYHDKGGCWESGLRIICERFKCLIFMNGYYVLIITVCDTWIDSE